jgi:hypothetical protein
VSEIAMAASGPPRSGGAWPGPTVLFAIAALAAIVSDVTTPLAPTILFVGVALLVAMSALAAQLFRSGERGFEARMLALVLPVAFCGYAVFHLWRAPPGQPASGIVAQALPAVERFQASLPVGPDSKTALLMEATLKSGPAADGLAAVGEIAALKSIPLQKYLYDTAARHGGEAQKSRVVITLLTRAAGRPVTIELGNEDNFTLQEQYLEGSSIRFAVADQATSVVRAALETNAGAVAMDGQATGATLVLSGVASLADAKTPLTLDATLGPGLTFSGAFHFAGGAGVPFTAAAF